MKRVAHKHGTNNEPALTAEQQLIGMIRAWKPQHDAHYLPLCSMGTTYGIVRNGHTVRRQQWVTKQYSGSAPDNWVPHSKWFIEPNLEINQPSLVGTLLVSDWEHVSPDKCSMVVPRRLSIFFPDDGAMWAVPIWLSYTACWFTVSSFQHKCNMPTSRRTNL